MQVILKKTILDKLSEAILAVPQDRTIDYIELTEEETKEFGELYSSFIAQVMLEGKRGCYTIGSTVYELRCELPVTPVYGKNL